MPLSASVTTSFRLAQVLKSLPLLGVEGQPGRFFAGGEREAFEDLQGPGVELDDLAGVFHVDEDMPLLIGNSQLGNAPQRPGCRPTFISAGSIAVVSLLPWLKVKTRRLTGSK